MKLPDDYMRFLRRHNGGYLDNNHLPDTGVSVRYLYSAGPNDHEYIDDLMSIAHLYSPESEAYSRVADSVEEFLERIRPRSVVGFEKAFPPASDETIQRVEAAPGITLPADYYLYSAGPNDDDNIFGENSFDDVLCIKVRGTDSGAVYLWSHDALANTDPFERVADGFGMLFAALRPGSE